MKFRWKVRSEVDARLCDGPVETSEIDCINVWQYCDCVVNTVADPDCPFCNGWGGGYCCLVHDFPLSMTIQERLTAAHTTEAAR